MRRLLGPWAPTFASRSQLLADLEFNASDDEGERQLKLDVVAIYNRRVDDRERRKRFVVEHCLPRSGNGAKNEPVAAKKRRKVSGRRVPCRLIWRFPCCFEVSRMRARGCCCPSPPLGGGSSSLEVLSSVRSLMRADGCNISLRIIERAPSRERIESTQVQRFGVGFGFGLGMGLGHGRPVFSLP